METTITLPEHIEIASWPEVMQAHRGWLSSIVYARVRDSEAVQEVLQETALAASRQCNFGDDNDGIFRWLYKVAVRQAILYLRKKSRSEKRIREVTTRNTCRLKSRNFSENPLRILIATESRDLVHRALDKLNNKDREILLLKYCDGWTCNDVAKRLGVSSSAIKSRLLRARRNLRGELLKLDEDW